MGTARASEGSPWGSRSILGRPRWWLLLMWMKEYLVFLGCFRVAGGGREVKGGDGGDGQLVALSLARMTNHETIMQQSCGSSLETTNEPQRVLKDADSVHQTECDPSMFDSVHFMESLNVEDCETPSRFHKSSSVPDALRIKR